MRVPACQRADTPSDDKSLLLSLPLALWCVSVSVWWRVRCALHVRRLCVFVPCVLAFVLVCMCRRHVYVRVYVRVRVLAAAAAFLCGYLGGIAVLQVQERLRPLQPQAPLPLLRPHILQVLLFLSPPLNLQSPASYLLPPTSPSPYLPHARLPRPRACLRMAFDMPIGVDASGSRHEQRVLPDTPTGIRV